MNYYYRLTMLLLACGVFFSAGISRVVADDAIPPQADTPRKSAKKAAEPEGAVLVIGDASPVIATGLKRIKQKAKSRVDIRHNHAPSDLVSDGYSWVLKLKPRGPAAPSLTRADQLNADAWAVTVSKDWPARVTIKALTDRAQLFALYHVAECLAAGKPLAKWAISRRPVVPKRLGWPSPGNVFKSKESFRPDLYRQALEELPALGINGVLITFTPTHGTHYGRDTIPFTLTKDGVAVDHDKLPKFRKLLDELKSYGLDIHLFHQAFTPPPFTREKVHAYYNGRGKLPGFDAAVEKSSRELAEAIFTHLPQVDGLLHHSIECDWFWGEAVSIFPCKDDKAAGDAFEAYLRGMSQACKAHGKDLMYWTHVSGISARQIRLQHKLVAKFPEVMVVEDHAWPNTMWPFAPVMGHVAKDLQAEVVKGRFGISIDTVDGEYFGAGALPTAYPEPHIRAAQAAATLGAEMSFVRMNEQCLTPLGTMRDINAIHVIASTEQWWENPRPTEQLWQEWCARRFGPAAAAKVASAVKKSAVFITKGASVGNMPLMYHSGLHPYSPGWELFAGQPGALLVDKPYDQVLGREFYAWQVQARGVKIEDFLRDSKEAEAAMHEALKEIESVRDKLAPEDATYLTTCFEDALLMIEAIRRAAVAHHAKAVFLKKRNDANRATLKNACAALDEYADHIESERGKDFRSVHFFLRIHLKGRVQSGFGAPIALRAIAEKLRK